MKFREITLADIPALFAIRSATDQNRLSREQLTGLGITEVTVAEKLRGSYSGWLCEEGGRAVGFAMGDRATGELWVIAVLPEFTGRGIGSELMRRVEARLQRDGCPELWLTTVIDTNLRSYAFYRNRGWEDHDLRDGVRYMRKKITESKRVEATSGMRPEN